MDTTAGSSSRSAASDAATESSVVDSNVNDLSSGSPAPAAPAHGPAPTDPATGHYGPGYGDPKRHYGNDPPPRSSPDEAPAGSGDHDDPSCP